MLKLRAAAAKVIVEVVAEGRSLTEALTKVLSEFSDSRDRGLLQAICYGVCRWYFRLDKIAKLFLSKPLKQKDFDVYVLILIGLYQLDFLRVPAHAAVGETVAAVKTFKKSWAKGLINGVLRQYQRERDEVDIKETLEYRFSHPSWIIEKIKKAYPKDWEAILEANNQHPPFALRVNQQYVKREDYLKKNKLKVEIIPETTSGFFLENPIDVNEIPGFAEGMVSVQDGAAQLAAELLDLKPGQRILDACAAPGGKTAHMLEIQPAIECIAVDKDPERLISVKENLARLKLSAKCIVADVGQTESWWDQKLFDRILLDAPCSASGVIRRHPDIKLLRQAEDIDKLAAEQLRLLNALWQLLKKDGILLYATCSVFSEENEQVLEQFLALHPEAKEEKIMASWGVDCKIGKQIYPGIHNLDGFYYARLKK